VLRGTLGSFCNVLVSFLRGSRTGTIYGFGNVVGGVPIGSVSAGLSIVKSKGQQRRFAMLRGDRLYGGAAGARKYTYLIVSIMKLVNCRRLVVTEFYGWIEALVHLATQYDEPSNLSFPFLRLNSPQASFCGSQPVWDEGADENGLEA
jgi:hypothetical protein